MPRKTKPSVNVDVPPARARAPRFRALRALGTLFVLALVALGVWKAYELILIALGWYGEKSNVIHAVLVAIALLIFVSAVAVTVRRYRERKSDYAPINSPQSAAHVRVGHRGETEVAFGVDEPVSTPLHASDDPDAPREPLRDRRR